MTPLSSGKINLLLFQYPAGGIGFDTSQISGMIPAEKRFLNDTNLISLHSRIDLHNEKQTTPELKNPRILSLKNINKFLLVEEPTDMIEVNTSDIKSAGKFLQSCSSQTGLWGIYFRNNLPFPLFDLSILCDSGETNE